MTPAACAARTNNILKRLLIHVAGFNLSLVMRRMFGLGTSRGLQGLAARLLTLWEALWQELWRMSAWQIASVTCPHFMYHLL